MSLKYFASAPVFHLALAAIGFSSPASARTAAPASKEVRYKETTLELHSGDKILMTGVRASIHLIQGKTMAVGEAKTNIATLRARKMIGASLPSGAMERFEALNLQVRRDGNLTVIEAKGPVSKTDWLDWTQSADSNSVPQMIFDLIVPAQAVVPVEIAFHDGAFLSEGWRGPATVSMISGKITSTDSEGELKIQLQKGEMKVLSHHGSVEIDSFAGKLSASDIEGDLKLANFTGESSLKNVTGAIQLRTHGGATTLASCSGSVDFDLGRGALKADASEGPLRGQTDHAPVVAQIEGEADVDVNSNQGIVSLRMPQDSGANVSLQTETGYISAPDSIHPGSTATSKTAIGRLKGDGPRGLVAVRTKSAPIRLRQAGTANQLESQPVRAPAAANADSSEGAEPDSHLERFPDRTLLQPNANIDKHK